MGVRAAWRRLLGRDETTAWDPARGDLVVVVSSFDDAESCSAALERAVSWTAAAPALLRHHLRIPAEQVEAVVAIAAQDDYSPAGAAAPDPELVIPGPENGATTVDLLLQRVLVLDALHCSQERSRMAGLAQRHEGSVSGWDALQPERN
ncbi:hypothetical protein KO481_21095 [Nocardia sp. NEAU-G5]|uniref:Uncharacterized protein n=1 Tax=Nocardia albiluteola TaxID=2842303 RepID=A0ABS6B3J7_9NOCA|nr:hypothetical protein [Nocardia albiluteola]MBU3064016.1 hypothetical protein [Nocardia albiluteola]